MGAMAVVETQVDEAVKSQVQQVLDREGLTLSGAFHFFLERTAHENGIPSEVFRPNTETIAAMEAAREETSLPSNPSSKCSTKLQPKRPKKISPTDARAS